MQALPIVDLQRRAAAARIDSRGEQHLAGVQIADPRDGFLIEQRRLDRAAAAGQTRAKIGDGDRQRVGSQRAVVIAFGQLLIGIEANRTEPATVPVVDDAAVVEFDLKSEMLGRRRIGQQHEPRHPRFQNDRLAPFDADDDPLAEPIDGDHLSPDRPLTKLRRGRLDGDRPTLARHALGRDDPSPDDRQNAAPHRFYFRKFRHRRELPVVSGQWSVEYKNEALFSRGACPALDTRQCPRQCRQRSTEFPT